METKKRVVLLRSNPVNPDPPVEKIASALIKNGYQVIVVAWDREDNYEIKEEKLSLTNGRNAQIIRLGIPAVYGGGLKRTLKALLIFQLRLRRWLKDNKDKYDIIHAFDFDTGFVAKGIAKSFNKKLVYHILDFYVDSHPSGGKLIRKIVKNAEFSVINYADSTIICTEKRREQIKGSKPRHLAVIHNTPSNDEICVDEALKIAPSNRLKIAYVGVFQEGRMLEELCQVVQENDKFELHIGGYGILEDKIKLYAEQNENIFFYGKLPYNSTLALEKQCDVLTAIYDPSVPNHKYTAPNKFYEALMLGKPIIMAKNTGFDEIVIENGLGILINYNKSALSKNLFLIQKTEDSTECISSKEIKLYEKQYSWNKMEERLNSLYGCL